MVGEVSWRSNQQEITDSVQAVYNIPVGPYTGVAYRVTIKAPENDTHNFILNSKDDSCQLEAKATQGNDTINTGLYYKWYRATNSITGWEQITGASGKTITVKASEVDCTREFMVEVYNDKAMDKDPSILLYRSEKASLQIRVKLIDEAIETASECIRLFPDSSDGYLFLGLAQCLKGDKALGVVNLLKAKDRGDAQADVLIEKYGK